MTSNPSLSWQKIHDVYYSLRPCYETLNWSISNLYSDYKVKISTYTTLIALSTKAPYPSLIEIYNISGTKISSIIFNSTPSEHIIDFEWHNEDLYVVLSNQTYRHYRDLKGNFNEYSFTQHLIQLDNFGDSFPLISSKPNLGITNFEKNESEEIFHVTKVYIWGNFLFLQLTNRFIITDLNNHQNYEIPLANDLTSNIQCISVVELKSHQFTIVICYDNTAISMKIDILANNFELIDHGLTDGPFTMVSVSPNGQLIALLNSKVSTIFVINNQFTQVLLEYDTSNDSSLPYQLQWCGNDAIVLSLRDEIKLLGPNQASISFFYDVIEEDTDFDAVLKGNDELSFTIVHLKTEPDGVKILSSNKLEFLSRVPQYCINSYQIGSSHPSSMLLNAVDKLSLHSSKADANITLLKSDKQLLNAINESLEVALYEFNPYWQKKILSSVSFGKAYCDESYNSEKYLSVVNTLKVLNQLRASDISIFLTSTEIDIIGWSSIIDMLLRRDHYLLAIKILELMNLEYLQDRVYIHWCCYKLRKEVDMDDTELFKIISKKLISARKFGDSNEDTNENNYLSVSEITEIAYEEGRIDLCKSLINLEPSMINKIQQYLKFDELELALIKCFQYGEYDLAKLILVYLYDTLSVSQFFKILHQNQQLDTNSKGLFVSGELVEHFWVQSIGKLNKELIQKYYKQEDMRIELSIYKLQEFLHQDYEEQPNYYDDYKAKLQELNSHFGDKKNHKYYQYELEVLELRKKLSETYQSDFFQLNSITQILTKLIQLHQLKQCIKIVRDFKIATEKLWYLIVETYAKAHEFERLHQFIVSMSSPNNLKAPISFQDIVETCLAYKGPSEYISIYIENCQDIHYSEKIQMFIRNDDLVSAANEAYHYKDIEFLRSILERATKLANDTTVESIKGMIGRLGY